MITKIQSPDRHFTDMGWLKTYWLFSFSNYHDPTNVQHGRLRVFNDDIVEPQEGFGKHPHEEMEIVSIVLEGEMFHKDTMGNESVIKAGDVQRMTAGTGLYHSEVNVNDTPVHFYQIWILPDKSGLIPSYDQKSFTPEAWHNRFALLASEKGGDDVVSLNTDAGIYRAALDEDTHLAFSTDFERKLFIYVMNGEIDVNGTLCSKGDQARISGERELLINSLATSELVLVDVPS